jgi:hypothetical protein
MTNQPVDETKLSVANRVLTKFVAAVGEDKAISDTTDRLHELLLGDGTINNATLRNAMFGEDTE